MQNTKTREYGKHIYTEISQKQNIQTTDKRIHHIIYIQSMQKQKQNIPNANKQGNTGLIYIQSINNKQS